MTKNVFENGWCMREIFRIQHWDHSKYQTHIQLVSDLLESRCWKITVPIQYLSHEKQQEYLTYVIRIIQNETKSIRTNQQTQSKPAQICIWSSDFNGLTLKKYFN